MWGTARNPVVLTCLHLPPSSHQHPCLYLRLQTAASRSCWCPYLSITNKSHVLFEQKLRQDRVPFSHLRTRDKWKEKPSPRNSPQTTAVSLGMWASRRRRPGTQGMWVGVPGGPCVYSGVTWTPDSTWEAEATPMVPAGQLFVETVGARARARQVGTPVSRSGWSRNGAPPGGNSPALPPNPGCSLSPPGSALLRVQVT